MHVFFLSPERTLSEYRYTKDTGWVGGNACPLCVTHSGFKVAEGSEVLYVAENPKGDIIQVGFVSAGAPGTLSEVVTTNKGQNWQLAPLPVQIHAPSRVGLSQFTRFTVQ